MIHSWDNPPPISLSFKLAFVVPRRCIYALTSIHSNIPIDYKSNTHRSLYKLLGQQLPFDTYTFAHLSVSITHCLASSPERSSF